MSRRGSRHPTNRQYPRTARLNELLREIVADELERVDDERLALVTVTAVQVEPDLRHAMVLFDALDGEAGDDDAIDALGEARVRLQAAIGRQARAKRVPHLSFAPDPAVRAGERVDSILRVIEPELDRARDDDHDATGDHDVDGEHDVDGDHDLHDDQDAIDGQGAGDVDDAPRAGDVSTTATETPLDDGA